MAATKWGTKRYLQMNRLAEVKAIAWFGEKHLNAERRKASGKRSLLSTFAASNPIFSFQTRNPVSSSLGKIHPRGTWRGWSSLVPSVGRDLSRAADFSDAVIGNSARQTE